MINNIFIIDSNKLELVENSFFGFSVQDDGIYDIDNPISDVNMLDGTGVYVSIQSEGDTIRIRQDYIGCFGLYLYEKENYFVISNSFFLLVEYLRTFAKITVNVDYYQHMFSVVGSSLSESKTPVNEIKLLPRDIEIIIDRMTRSYRFNKIDYAENTISLTSIMGISIVDRWFEKYTNIIRNLVKQDAYINVDVSGGFDSRLVLLLLISSGVPMEQICFTSYKDTDIHREDYIIAESMAQKYGFKLNQEKKVEYSIMSNDEILDSEYYTRWGFTKELSRYEYNKKFAKKMINFSGSGGELLRGYGMKSKNETIYDINRVIYDRYTWSFAKELEKSTLAIVESAYKYVEGCGNYFDEKSICYAMYGETRARSHYGKYNVRCLSNNHYVIAPHLDPLLHKIRIIDSTYKDPYTLFSLMMVRYLPSIMNFPYEGKRGIKKETVELACSINEKYPKQENTCKSDKFSIQLKASNKANTSDCKKREVNNRNRLNRLFFSRWCKGTFCTYFDEELYNQAIEHNNNAINGRFFQIDNVLAAAITIQKCKQNRDILNGIANEIDRIEKMDTVYTICKDVLISKKQLGYITARFDVFMRDANQQSFRLINLSEADAMASIPKWINNGRCGYMIQTKHYHIEAIFHTALKGMINIQLMGVDIRNKDNIPIEYWIKYMNVTVNGKKYIEDNIVAWVKKPYCIEYAASANETIYICVDWQPNFSK